MQKETEIFDKILKELDKKGVLRDIILIGGWCPLVYQEHFHAKNEIHFKATTDIDLLIPNPPKIRKEVDVGRMLTDFGFDQQISPTTGLCNYINPLLKVEFLTPEKGSGRDKPYNIKKLGINAVGLRYLTLLEANTIKAAYKGITLNVPEPAAFVLHKFIISARRPNPTKKEKDVDTAKDIGHFILKHEPQKMQLLKVYDSLPNKWRLSLLDVLKKSSLEIYGYIHEQRMA